MRLIGIEPTHAAPEATALSTELQAHPYYNTILLGNVQVVFRKYLCGRLLFGGDFVRIEPD